MTLLDLDLADRFATAAAQAGAAGAAGVRAMNLVLLGRGEQAETALQDMADTDVARRPSLGDRAGRQPDLDARPAGRRGGDPRRSCREVQRPREPGQVAERSAVEACLDAVSARCELAAEKARAALDSEALPDFHAMMASLALIMAMGALGEVDDLAGVAEQALRRATTSFQASHMRFWFGGVYARACRLTGRIDELSARQSRWPTRRATFRVWPTPTLPSCWGTPTWSAALSRRGPTAARSACRGGKTRRHNGFAAGELLRAGRGARQARAPRRSE